MSPSPGRALAALIVLALGACADRADTASAPKPAATRAAPASDSVCVEHGVLEAVCTKCNPQLASIFQAKGDWCEEHGFPDSFCPTCRPERGGRPAVDVSTTDGAPLDGTRVVLRAPEAVRAAAIESATALAPEPNAALTVLATVEYDPARRAEVNPRLAGVVRDIRASVGTRVAKGQSLFTIESAELGVENSRRATARAHLSTAEMNRERVQRLFDEGLAARKDLLEVELDVESARAAVASSEGLLKLLDILPDAPNAYSLTAPLDGVVMRVSAVAGRMVDLEEMLAEIVDTSAMWVALDIPERDIARVELGRPVQVQVGTLPDRTFESAIDYLAPDVDRKTRTVKARAHLANTDGALRAGMFARATIALGASAARSIVPIDAVQRAGSTSMVFVKLAADTYEVRRVKLGTRRGEGVEIVQGVEVGEAVATRGSFLLKTETLRGSIGAGCCEVE